MEEISTAVIPAVVAALAALAGVALQSHTQVRLLNWDRVHGKAAEVAKAVADVEATLDKSESEDPLGSRLQMEEVIIELRNLERTHLFGHSERELRLSVRDAIATAQQLTHAQCETEDDWTDEDDQAFVQLRDDLEDIRRALDRYLRSVRLGRFRRLSVPRA